MTWLNELLGRIRPQILLAIVVLGTLGWVGMALDFDTIAGVAVGGIIALGMKILEKE